MEQTLLIGLVVGVVEVLKRTGLLDSKYAPLAALVVGVGLSLLTGNDVVNGLVGALVGMGIWDAGKTSLKVSGVVK
jgi:hypothetical protein